MNYEPVSGTNATINIGNSSFSDAVWMAERNEDYWERRAIENELKLAFIDKAMQRTLTHAQYCLVIDEYAAIFFNNAPPTSPA